MMRLVQLPVSLYSFKVRLALKVMGVDVPYVEPHDGSYRSAAYRTLVKPGTIPALLGPDFVLTETDAIIEYLDETHARSRLMHGDALRRARVRMLSRLVDLRLEAAVRSLFGHVAPAGRDAAQVARARDQIVAALDVLEWAFDPDGPFCLDASVSMADCALAATLTWLEALKPALLRDVRIGPRVARVFDALLRDPVTGPPMADYRGLVAAWVETRVSSSSRG